VSGGCGGRWWRNWRSGGAGGATGEGDGGRAGVMRECEETGAVVNGDKGEVKIRRGKN
jgi:hypothetical protein